MTHSYVTWYSCMTQQPIKPFGGIPKRNCTMCHDSFIRDIMFMHIHIHMHNAGDNAWLLRDWLLHCATWLAVVLRNVIGCCLAQWSAVVLYSSQWWAVACIFTYTCITPQPIKPPCGIQIVVRGGCSIDATNRNSLQHTAEHCNSQSSKPFGGIQIVVCGDFFQLPPVSGRDEPDVALCFESRGESCHIWIRHVTYAWLPRVPRVSGRGESDVALCFKSRV